MNRIVQIFAAALGAVCLAVAAPSPASAQTITEFTLPTAGSQPVSIAAGSDGALWFAQFNANRIGRITTGAPPPPAAVPTMTEWAMILLALMLAGGAAVHLQRRRFVQG